MWLLLHQLAAIRQQRLAPITRHHHLRAIGRREVIGRLVDRSLLHRERQVVGAEEIQDLELARLAGGRISLALRILLRATRRCGGAARARRSTCRRAERHPGRWAAGR